MRIHPFSRLSACLAVLLLVGATLGAQDWMAFESQELNVRFQVPGRWSTETEVQDGVPMLTAVSPDGDLSLFVYAYKDLQIGTEELLDKAVADLGVQLTGEAEETEINGLHAWVATAHGVIDGSDAGVVIMAATYEEDNHVAYVFTPFERFERNAELMGEILGTFEPIRK